MYEAIARYLSPASFQDLHPVFLTNSVLGTCRSLISEACCFSSANESLQSAIFLSKLSWQLAGVKTTARLQISAGHWTFVRQIWGFDRETAQSDRTAWRASPVKVVISLKKANFNIWLWWITIICVDWKFSFHWIEIMSLHQYSCSSDFKSRVHCLLKFI